LMRGFLWQSTTRGDTLYVVALHPSRQETGSSRPALQLEDRKSNGIPFSQATATGSSSFFSIFTVLLWCHA
jgi:hypothetical protein